MRFHPIGGGPEDDKDGQEAWFTAQNRIPYRIDRRLSGLAGPDYDATLSFGLPIEPEDSQYGKSRIQCLQALATGSVSRGRDPGDTMANINFKMPKARPRLLWQLVDPKAHTRVDSYLFQCGLATIFLIAVLLLQDAVLRAAIIVAVASSAFIIFVVPDSVAATPRRVIGGHIVGHHHWHNLRGHSRPARRV